MAYTGIGMDDAILRQGDQLMDAYVPLFTGNKTIPIDDTWEGSGEIEIVSDEPQPCTVRLVNVMVDREPGSALRYGG
jgi:hypothetical protein